MSKRVRKWPKVVVVLVLLGAAFAAYSAGRESEVVQGPPCSATAVGGTFDFENEQARHASTIAAVAKRKGLPDRAVSIGIATAFQESGLRNIDYGDLDSVGLFQQRPSQGWGTIAEIMTPSTSAAKFFDGLVKVEGWQAMEITDAAQAVQRSAYPKAYAKWDTQARVMAQALVGQVPAGFACRADVSPGTPTMELSRAIQAEVGGIRPNARVTEQQGWLLSGWLIGHAEQWNVGSLTFSGFRWTAESGKWKPTGNPEPIVRINA